MPNQRVSAAQRRAVAKRARDCCEYCWSQAHYATQSFSVEHIVPRKRGGKTALDNLAFACQGCNNHKHTKITGLDPINQETVPLFHPRHQRWQDHFAWDHSGARILGLTATGRATVETMQLNRGSVVNLRRVLVAMGEHPPKI